MKNCLFSKDETDLLSALRRNEDIVKLISENIFKKSKELGGQFVAGVNGIDANKIENRSMITIGG
jgi:cyclic pyranopterin phosphate synthase